jgi:hypothetical protein
MSAQSTYNTPAAYTGPGRISLSPQSGIGMDLTRSMSPRVETSPYRGNLNGAINVQSNLGPRKELDLYDNFLSSQDDFTPEIKNLIGMYLDTPLDLADILVYGHESATRPDNLAKLCNDRTRILKMHEDLKQEALLHRQRVAQIVNDNKTLFPERPDANGQHLKNAIFDLNNTPRGPDKVSQQMRELKDDITVLLDKDITTLPQNKYSERQLGKSKRSQLYPQAAPVVINQPASSTVKLKLSPDDKYVSHEVMSKNPSDDVKVVIEKQPAPVMRSVSPPPVYRPEVVNRTIMSPSPPPKIRSPTKSAVSLNQSTLEQYQTPPPLPPVIIERNIVPVRPEP